MNMMQYRGYLGTVEYSAVDRCLFGKLAFISDLVNYEAQDVETLEREFHISVDEYLKDCEEMGKDPDQPLKGTFNVRVGPDLHRDLVLAAGDKTLNAFVVEALREKVAASGYQRA